jgi:hypothetical protein
MTYQENVEIQELSKDLVSFGLNPRDWRLIKENEELYRIESEEDEDFVFMGSIIQRQKTKAWGKIEIANL